MIPVTTPIQEQIDIGKINYVDTYENMLVLCTGTAQKIFLVKSSSQNSNSQTLYSYDGSGGIFWIAAVKVN